MTAAMRTSSICSVFVVLAFGLLGGCERKGEAPCECSSDSHLAHDVHTSTTKTEHELYALPGLDHGLVQSPVNILSQDAVHGKHRVAVHYDHTAPNFIVNKGTTIELDFPTGASISYDGNDYDLEQLHFHTPSEHQIDGVTYPMSLHIVNRMHAAHANGKPHYLVIAILFRMGRENDFIASFLEMVPVEPGTAAELEPDVVYLDELLPARQMPRYFHYRGSLTTPPHTETVEWLVLKDIQEAAPEQIRRINAIEGDNARHVQALYGRAVED